MKIQYDAYAPTLSPALKDLLLTISGSRTMAKCLTQRADIALLSAQRMTNWKISDKVGLHVNQVGKWRRRFLGQVERLNAVAQEKPADLEKELLKVLQE